MLAPSGVVGTICALFWRELSLHVAANVGDQGASPSGTCSVSRVPVTPRLGVPTGWGHAPSATLAVGCLANGSELG